MVTGGNHSMSEKGYLVKLEPIQKIVECAILSPYIKDEKPVSLLITAKPESGKTSVMKEYRENKGILYLTDCTAYGIEKNYLHRIVQGDVRTIMIPDLLTPLAKQTKTRRTFVAFINSLIEEGVSSIATGALVWDKQTDASVNVITSVTDQALRDARHGWAKLGFLSRFIIFSYSYSRSSVYEILKRYSIYGLEQNEKTQKTKLKLPRKSVKIGLSTELADKLDPIAIAIGEQHNLYGFRAKINFRNLLKCITYHNGRREVTEEDFKEFIELADFMNSTYNPI
jgi:hypothetical protein